MASDETICALATGSLPSAIALIRVSGREVKNLIKSLCSQELKPRLFSLCKLRDEQGRVIDEALAVFFPAPNSYTGEDMLELSVHGGRAVVAHLLESLLINENVRLAEPGEFTRRAFEAEKLDLTRAEAIADLVDAETSAQKDQALRQLDGALTDEYEVWRAELLRALALVEVTIDFPDEDDAPEEAEAPVYEALERLVRGLELALEDDSVGERIREGFRVVIMGPPNAGKSSLLNRLSKRDIAIVSDQPGTTRDIIEVRLMLAGVLICLSDTAGIRSSGDSIETEGVRRALKLANEADVRIHVVDGINQRLPEQDIREKDLVVISKSDLGVEKNLANFSNEPISISAKTGEGIGELENLLRKVIINRVSKKEAPLITRYRHREILTEGLSSLKEAIDSLKNESGGEITGECLRRAERSLSKLVGAVSVEDVLGEVFSQFCIGK